ncbi:hypothetical protein BJY16_000206 [Actinoplanes octamycinicus]|uniref:Uncharacterized protein n=1 Tax=Actinoplanes octamycinicus TaxID=135948 RepID=A0A7W7GR44_9ACTN|nr:hypothetical protein [Actinoplanes octamycinicus]MBB4736747.1 hypothetical protein [Actinoplanes octamycinicus]GIE60514.1 hypothetical protein Aoc01nite_59160 [Actinoplanes octamycinicus]
MRRAVRATALTAPVAFATATAVVTARPVPPDPTPAPAPPAAEGTRHIRSR